jgi:hypothetical protein
VLVVENHPDTRICIALCLEESGYQVQSVTSMREALDVMKIRSFDVILSDFGLNDGDGWRLLEQAGSSRPPFAIAMSGYGTAQDLKKSNAAGYYRHLVKPFTAAELRAVMKEAESFNHGGETGRDKTGV